MKPLDPYKELGLRRDADAAAIKRAYRKRSAEVHPDKGGSSEAFDRVNRAKIVLSDPARRAKFDETGIVDDDRATNDPDNAAWAVIGELIGRAIAHGDDIFRMDAVEGIRGSIRENIRNGAKQKADLAAMGARAKKMADRFHRPDAKGDNRLKRIAEYHADRCRQMLASIEAHTKIGERAIELLKPYKFLIEVPAPVQQYQSYGMGTAAGIGGLFRNTGNF